jgi:tyrosinase
LEQFNTPWNLGRNLGGSLPSASDVNTVLGVSAFSSGGASGNGFGGGPGNVNNPSQGDLELIHNAGHMFVGGIMMFEESPRDPVFFFHHSFVDKIWQDWTGTSSFSGNSLPAPYSSTNPHNIVDSRDLNVWYAEDGLVLLDQYETSGTNDYRYTGKIKAEDDFVVKNGSDVTFIAGEEIVLGPEFQVEAGGEFYAEVNPDVGNIAAKQRSGLAEGPPIQEETPKNYSLAQNYPNPFNPATVIPYELPVAGHVTLEVFDMLGRRVAVLVDEAVSAGRHEVRFDAGSLSSGVYIYRITAGDYVQSRQMVLVK